MTPAEFEPINPAIERPLGSALANMHYLTFEIFHLVMQLLQLKPPKCILVIILISPKLFYVFSTYDIKSSEKLFKVQEMQYDIYAFICFYIICFYMFYDKFYYNSCVSTPSYIKYTLTIS